MGAWAPSAQQKVKGGVLVIHENRGLTPHIANVAGRFAANGFSALALDLLSRGGRDGARSRTRRRSWPSCRRSRPKRRRALRRRHEGRADRDRQARRPPDAAVGDRLLLRRRHDLAPARRQGEAPVSGGAVLRPVPDRRRPARHQGRGAGRLRRRRRPRERHARGGARGAGGRPPGLRDPHVHRGPARVLQRHEPRPVQRAGRRRRRGCA